MKRKTGFSLGILLWFLFCFYSGACEASETVINSFSGFNGSYLIQFLGIKGGIPAHGAKDRKSGDDIRPSPHESQHSPYTWHIGINYGLNTTPSTGASPAPEQTWGGTGGFGVEFGPQFNANISVNKNDISNESYSHGSGVLRMEYILFFGSRPESKPETASRRYDSRDAWQYYAQQREKTMRKLDRKIATEGKGITEAELEASQLTANYPRLKIGYILGFNSHTFKPASSSTTASTTTTTTSSSSTTKSTDTGIGLNQFQTGPEIIYQPGPRTNYKAFLSLYSYSKPVDTFLPLMRFDNSARVPTLPYNGISPLANQLLSFPTFSLGLGADWLLGQLDRFVLAAALTAYESVLQVNTYSFSPMYYYGFNKDWTMGFGGGVTLGGIALFPNAISIAGVFELKRYF